jgi:hypothetical protein
LTEKTKIDGENDGDSLHDGEKEDNLNDKGENGRRLKKAV